MVRDLLIDQRINRDFRLESIFFGQIFLIQEKFHLAKP